MAYFYILFLQISEVDCKDEQIQEMLVAKNNGNGLGQIIDRREKTKSFEKVLVVSNIVEQFKMDTWDSSPHLNE